MSCWHRYPAIMLPLHEKLHSCLIRPQESLVSPAVQGNL